jgi:biotin carboxylase
VSSRRAHLILVGCKDFTVESLRPLDLDVTLVQSPELLTAAQLAWADRIVALRDGGVDAVIAGLRAIHALHPAEAAVSFTEEFLAPAARIAEALAIAGNPAAAVAATRDKVRMREVLATFPGRGLEFASCRTRRDVERFADRWGYPVILKPSVGSGSRGVTLVENAHDIAGGLARCLDGFAAPAIVERYVIGAEVSVETLTDGGRHEVVAITEKLTTGPPAFVETGHQLPARLPPETRERVEYVALWLLDRIGHWVGPAHTECRITPDGDVAIIESHTRFGGDQIWEMVELVTGVPLAAATVCGLLGMPRPTRRSRTGGAAIRFFAEENGVVRRVSGVHDATGVPGVVRVDLRTGAGDVLGPLESSRTRQGYVLATGSDTDDAVRRVESAFGCVRIVLDR